ncbi:hypothetical protein NDU88_005323 [Pleurodeles waltl]|uniref:Uncharacterized protein n=1 Tax=Pleurodeles waltl TaxID=8319 RepID=A0AAV7PI81_PLEWA|nr:hypothetical protein NDU88_005323 [Pleurodeles waltl]
MADQAAEALVATWSLAHAGADRDRLPLSGSCGALPAPPAGSWPAVLILAARPTGMREGWGFGAPETAGGWMEVGAHPERRHTAPVQQRIAALGPCGVWRGTCKVLTQWLDLRLEAVGLSGDTTVDPLGHKSEH